MKVRVSEAERQVLDWMVAKAEEYPMGIWYDDDGLPMIRDDEVPEWKPSTDWSQGGPIIERERIRLETNDHPDLWPWFATKLLRWEKREDEEMGDWPVYAEGGGDTPLIAAMRCYVVTKLGDEIEVPDELINWRP